MAERLLIVDDLPRNLRLLRAVLESEGYVVEEAADGVEALAKLKEEAFDGVISDILMPHMDGYRLCREVRATPHLGQLPFLFYTSTYISPEDEHLARVCGGDGYLRKPAPAEQLIGTVRELLKAERPPEHPAQGFTASDQAVMDYYNASLVRKLEEKNTELTVARDHLAKLNDELEQRVAERTAELREANEELDAFSQSIAHDLRSPIMAISLLSMVLKNEGQDLTCEEWRDHVVEIERTTQRMHELVDDLLALARASRGELDRSTVDLSALAQSVGESLPALPGAAPVEFVVTPGLSVEGDSSLLRIALENLLGNAWKYSSRQASPRVEFSARQAGGETIYYVRDNGAGFDPQKAGQLFQPFVRLHSAEEFSGTGIGLTTVRRVVHRHGGRVWAEAQVGAGATFYFTLAPSSSAPEAASQVVPPGSSVPSAAGR